MVHNHRLFEERIILQPMTFRLSNDLRAELDRIAALRHSSRSWIVTEALRIYLNEQSAFAADVADALHFCSNHPIALIPHPEAMDRLRAAVPQV